MKIFGYGSLLSAQSISEHKLGPEKFTESDLKEVILHDYERSFNATDAKWRYLGVVHKPGASCNGVIFDLEENEVPMFKKVEGIPEIYDLKDVTKNIEPFQIGKVYTLITKHPTDKGIIPKSYLHQLKDALKFRSKEFQKQFSEETKTP